ncbi:opacity protein-like surface antigen [Elusimicrobium posterum]|uniref:outer membrane beta-barrel protein n=1 Tax=Elusimicrobium posterum TaxID=3116653 RepID=UPI003C7663A7
MKIKIYLFLAIILFLKCEVFAGDLSPYIGATFGPVQAEQKSSYTSNVREGIFKASASGGLMYKNLRTELAYSYYSPIKSDIFINDLGSIKLDAKTEKMNSIMLNTFYGFYDADGEGVFVGAGIGLLKYKTKISFPGVFEESGKSSSDLAIALYAGATAHFSEKVLVDIFIEYMWADNDMSILGNDINIKTSTIGLGIGLRFKI